MNALKPRWLCYGDCIINLDNVIAFHQSDNDVIVSFSNGNRAVFKNITTTDIREYLKIAAMKRR